MRAKKKSELILDPKKEVLPYTGFAFLLIFKLQFFFSNKYAYFFCQRFKNLLNFCFKANLKMDG